MELEPKADSIVRARRERGMRIDGCGGEEDRIVSGDEENRWEWRRGG